MLRSALAQCGDERLDRRAVPSRAASEHVDRPVQIMVGHRPNHDPLMALRPREPGRECNAGSAGHQRQGDEHVVAAMADVGFEARGVACARSHASRVRLLVRDDPRIAGEVAQRDRASAAGQGMPARNDRKHLVATELVLGEVVGEWGWRECVLLLDGRVELPEADIRQDIRLGCHQLESQLRVALGQQSLGDGYERDERSLNRGEAKGSAYGPRRGLQIRLGRLELRQQRVGVTHQTQPGIGQPEPPAHALGKRHAGLALKLRELLRDRRRRIRQRLRDRHDGPSNVQLAQKAELAYIEHLSPKLKHIGKKPALDMNNRRAQNRRMTSITTHEEAVSIRVATDADAAVLHDLALLDSARPLRSPIIVAEVDETPVAARSLTDGRAVADPFVYTAGILDLLTTYAAHVAAAAEPRRPRWSLPVQRLHVRATAPAPTGHTN
jgi:hypothetical protein